MKTFKKALILCSAVVLTVCVSLNVHAQALVKARPLQLSSTAGTITIQAPAPLTGFTLTLPQLQGGSGSVLSNDGTGILSWVTSMPPNGTAGGDLSGTYPNPSIGSGVVTGAKIASATIDLSNLSATGTKDNTTFLRGDNTWAVPSGGGGGGGTSAPLLVDKNSVTLGRILTIAGETVTILTSTGYIIPVLMTPNGTNAFPISQINWTGAACTGTPDLNDGGGAAETPTPRPQLRYYKVLCYSGQTGLLYSMTGADANGVSTSQIFANVSIENATCTTGGTGSGFGLASVTLTAAGLPAGGIAYPLSIQ
jgi:hypothetical protein